MNSNLNCGEGAAVGMEGKKRVKDEGGEDTGVLWVGVVYI
jgi:hypothetical protein